MAVLEIAATWAAAAPGEHGDQSGEVMHEPLTTGRSGTAGGHWLAA